MTGPLQSILYIPYLGNGMESSNSPVGSIIWDGGAIFVHEMDSLSPGLKGPCKWLTGPGEGTSFSDKRILQNMRISV